MWSRTVKFGLASLAVLVLGCVGELTLENPPNEIVGGPDAGGGGGGPGQTAFNTDVYPALTNRTCTTCHTDATCAAVGGGICFLGTGQQDSAYTSLKASPQMTTIVNLAPAHTGLEFCDGPGTAAGGTVDANCTEDQLSKVQAWIQLEMGGGI